MQISYSVYVVADLQKAHLLGGQRIRDDSSCRSHFRKSGTNHRSHSANQLLHISLMFRQIDLLGAQSIHHDSSCRHLQHTATHCNTLQHTATHCNTLPQSIHDDPSCRHLSPNKAPIIRHIPQTRHQLADLFPSIRH